MCSLFNVWNFGISVSYKVISYKKSMGHFEPRTAFWAGQEVGGTGQNFLVFLKSAFHGLSNGIQQNQT